MLLTSLLLSLVFAQGSAITPTESFTHSSDLASGNIKVYWKFDETHITLEVYGQTTGWVGIGFSPNGAMTGADIFVGWVKNGVAEVTDRHATGNKFPPLDTSQDIDVLAGSECDGWTMLKFSRQLAACEANYDREITDDTQRLIWAWGYSDPEGDITFDNYHGPENRGAQSMFVLQSSDAPSSLPSAPTYNTFDILADNFQVPAEDTYYNCKIYKLPVLTKKHHIVKIEPIIEAGNELNVHHMLVYRCGDVLKDPNELDKNGECYTQDVKHFDSCTTVIGAYGIGGRPTFYPDNAGFSIGAENDPIYIQMEVHYDNPAIKSDIVDNSGMRFTYTDSLREHDVGVMELGVLTFGMEHFIPPGAESFLSVGHCTPWCMGKKMEEAGAEEVTMFSVLLHSHLTGRSLRLRQIRNGVELPFPANDDTYDFHYQDARYLDPNIKLHKDDYLRVECGYNTQDRNGMTLGGQATDEEMCLGFIYYYPKVDVAYCLSSVFREQSWKYFGIDASDIERIPGVPFGPDGFNITAPPEAAGKTVLEWMNEYDWNDETIEDFETYYNSLIHYETCVTENWAARDFKPREIMNPYVRPKKKCIQPTEQPSQSVASQACPTEPSQVSTTSAATEVQSHFAILLAWLFSLYSMRT